MADYGTRKTDEAVKRAERRLRRVYKEAQRDIAEKLQAWQEAHKAREARYRKMVADGKMTQADFDAWMRGQVFQGKQWAARKAEIDKVLLNADKAAAKIVNEGKIGVFADNANYIGYGLEHDLRIDSGFTLYDESTVARLIQDDPQILPMPAPGVVKDKAFPYYNRLMSSAITQGILQGKTIGQIARRIMEKTGESSYNSAVRNARTAYTGAQNAGRIEGLHQAQRLGIEVKKKWLATLDFRTRDTHRDLDGQVRDVDEPFSVDGDEIDFPGDPKAKPALVYNCFIGETNIATDSKIIRSYKHDYSGKLIEVETSCGVKFTCTPNHPILTSGGWVPVTLLNNGDNLLIASVGNRRGLRRNGDIQHVHSCMKTFYNALHGLGLMSRDSTLRVNFHGDIPATNVEIITKKWKLWRCENAGCRNVIQKFVFKHPNAFTFAKGHFVTRFWRIAVSALRLMGSFGKTLALFGRRVLHTVVHRFRPIAGRDSAVLQAQSDNVAGDVKFLSERLDGFAGEIFVDNIVNIKITTVSHIPVYNLQTGNGHYFVNHIIAQNNEKCNGNFAIAHNCRCTLIYEYPEYPSSMERLDNITREKIGDMTYKQWYEWKGGATAEKEFKSAVRTAKRRR